MTEPAKIPAAPASVPADPPPAKAVTVAAPHASVCPNCGTGLTGKYCTSCGQKTGHQHMTLGELIHEFSDDYLHVDSKLPRTVWHLLRPGFLSREYLDGKRSRYVGPFKLYLLASVTYFLLWGLLPDAELPFAFKVTSDAPKSPAAQLATPVPSTAAPEEIPETPGRVEQWMTRLGAWLSGSGKEVVEMSAEKRDAFLRHTVSGYFPKLVLVLLPLFAFLLKLFYWSRATYPEQFVVALHFHTLYFFLRSLVLLLSAALGRVIGIEAITFVGQVAIVVWAFIALRRLFGQSRVRTGLKLAGIAWMYVTVLGLGMAAVILATAHRHF